MYLPELAVVRLCVRDGGGRVDEAEALRERVGGLDGQRRVLERAAQLDWADGEPRLVVVSTQ